MGGFPACWRAAPQGSQDWFSRPQNDGAGQKAIQNLSQVSVIGVWRRQAFPGTEGEAATEQFSGGDS